MLDTIFNRCHNDSMTRETKQFACIAEAVAHYFKMGFVTVCELEDGRIMRRGRDEVIINREGFLDVSAEAIFA